MLIFKHVVGVGNKSQNWIWVLYPRNECFPKRKDTRWLDMKGAMVCGRDESSIFFSLEILCGKKTSDMTKERQRRNVRTLFA